MKKHLLIVLACLSLLVLLFACDDKAAVSQIVEYSTPTIKGKISIPSGTNVSPDGVYVKVIDSSDKTVTIQKVGSDGTFVIQNLSADAKYKLLFTSKEPDTLNRDVSDEKGTDGVGGWMHDVVPAVKEGKDIGSVKMKPLGTIKGKAVVDGATEHYDTTVYIPGTSYVAMTDKDGNYAIYNVPEGTYTLRYTHEDCIAVMTEDVMVICTDDTTHPEKTLGEVKLLSNKGTVQGKAVLGDASDSTGITIKLESEDKSRSYPASTSADGTYTIGDVEPGRYRVIASYSTYLSQSTEYFDVAVGTVTSVSEKLELLENYGILKGAVSLSDSEKKEGIQILIKDTSSTNSYALITDAEGAFTKKLKPGEYSVTASLSDYSSQTRTVTVVEDETIESTFSPLLSVYGTVRGKSDSAGETVTLINAEGTPVSTVSTGEDCSYSFTKVTVGTYSVRFSRPGYASYIVSSVAVASSDTTTVDGKALVSSFGKISGTSNSIGETVSLHNESSSAVESVTTGSDRKYEFSNLAVGTYTLRFSKEGYSSFDTTSYTVSGGSSLTVNGEALVSLYGTISGKSCSSGETVYLIKGSQSAQSTTTIESREYTFSKIEPGDYIVRFTKDNYASSEKSIKVVAGQSYVVDGERLSELYGSISGKTNSSGEFVSLGDSTGTTLSTVQTASDCSFSFSRLNPGTYFLTVSKTGYSPATVENIIVNAGENTSITTPELISTTASVTGFVALEGGVDNSGVSVTITNSSDKALVYSSVSAADGSFRIDGITKGGTYFLTYSKDGYVSNLSSSVVVTVGKVSTISSITLKSVMATVSGKIQLDGASTHENITVLLKNGTNQYNATTDQKGGYRINGVLPGTYTLMASKDGYVTASTKEFVVESSSEKEVELLTLSIAIRSITGTVKLELLTDYAGALVTATNLADSTKVYSAITNSAGSYTLAGMTPGEYQIVISYNGYRTATLPTVNVVSSTMTTIALTEMQINRGTITGVAKLEGRSSSKGVAVELLRGSDVYETTTTDESGNYSFYVPQGNYTGVRYTMTDFASSSVSKDIALFADNYFSMGNETLKATHNSVYGTVDVLTTDDESAVTISFDGVTTIQSYVTQSDGSFRFDHVPVGSYTLRFQRQDCSDITIPVEVKAADGINLGKIEVTPNTATIKGKVNLENGTSLRGVKVSIDISGSEVLETYTDDSGRYEIGGIPITSEYTVTYSKDGWNAASQQISPKLTILEERELAEVTLLDTTAPSLTSVIINNNVSTTSNREVTLTFASEDVGSGLDKIMVTEDNIFDRAVVQYDYIPIFKWTLSAENGLKTLYIKTVDRAGNMSDTFTVSVTLTNQKTEVQGTMLDEYLTWTKDKSPYLVVGSVMVKEGTTLTIEPGVDVQFLAGYGITVEGTIKAIGTEDKKISFYGVDDGENNWLGINCRNNNGSMLKYVDVQGPTKGLQGYMTVLDSIIETDNYALYNFTGEICDSSIVGGACILKGSLINNSIKLKTSSVQNYNVTYKHGENYASIKNVICDSFLTGNVISENSLCVGGTCENNRFENMTLAISAGCISNSFIDCVMYISSYVRVYDVEKRNVDSSGSSYVACEFSACDFKLFDPTFVRNSNFVNCGTANITTEYNDYKEVDLTSNFWGYSNTKELQAYGLEREHSFIKDYYAAPEFSITKANISGYLEEPNDDAGYKGNRYYNYSSEATIEYKVGDTGPAGGIVFYDKGYYSNGWRFLEVATDNLVCVYFGYYRQTSDSGNRAVGTSTPIGAGRVNTDWLVEVMDIDGKAYYEESGEALWEYPARKCYDFESGGYSDWFLPSKGELNLIYENLYKEGLGVFETEYAYWSSSEDGASYVWYHYFSDGRQLGFVRDGFAKYVRPIRSF